MKAESMVAVSPDRNGVTFVGGVVTLAAMAALFLATAAPAASAGSGPAGPSHAVKFESIPGSTVKRVILTSKAAERLGIETGKVSEQRIVRKQMFGGQVIHPLTIQAEQKRARGSFGSLMQVAANPAPQPAASDSGSYALGNAWVRVTLSQEEWDRVAQGKPARVLPLATRDKLANELLALPSKYPPYEDAKRSMLTLYYVVPGEDHGLVVNDRMRVELQLLSSNKKRKITPYSSLYYDGNAKPWVYVQRKPFVYERQRVEVEQIVGDQAVLTDGPPVGTDVVTVGAALLYGAEVIYKR